MRLPLIKKQQVTDKNKAKCIENHGSFMISHCVYYYKITKICVVIDQLNNHWKQTSFCGLEYEEKVEDSSHRTQQIDFFDYTIDLEV